MKHTALLAFALLVSPFVVTSAAGTALDQAGSINQGTLSGVYDGTGGVSGGVNPALQATPTLTAAAPEAPNKSGGFSDTLGKIGDFVTSPKFLGFLGMVLLGGVLGFAVGAAVVGAGPAILAGAVGGAAIALIWNSFIAPK